MVKRVDYWSFIKKNYPYLLLITVLILTFVLIYKPHFDYKFPFHSDEWLHLAYATYIMEPHTDPSEYPALNVNPYLHNPGKDYEVGFHIFLAAIFSSIGIDPVLNYKFLPAVAATIAAFILFVFTYRMTKNFYTGILAILFFTGLRTNVNLLGLQFFIPLTAAIPLTYCFFMLLVEGVENSDWVRLFTAGGVLLSIFVIHPVSATFIAPIMFIYLILNINKIWHNKTGITLLTAIPCLSFIFFFTFLWKGTIAETFQFLAKHLVFERGKTLAVEFFYYLPRYFNGPFFNDGLFFTNDMTYLVIIGCFVSCIKFKKRILALWLGTAMALLAIFYNYHFTILAQYQRLLYYGLLVMAPLAAIGLSYLINLAVEPLQRFVITKKKYLINLLWFAATTFFVIIISTHTHEVFNYDNQYFYRIINWEEYNGILSLKINNIKHKTVMSWPAFSSALTPITGNYVVEHTLQFHGGKPSYYFLRSDCKKQRQMINRYGIDYLLYQYDWNCPGYEKLYDNGVMKLYKV